MTQLGYAPDPDHRCGCIRLGRRGERLGWCGTKHRYRDRAETHARVLNRSVRFNPNESWAVVPLTVAQGFGWRG